MNLSSVENDVRKAKKALSERFWDLIIGALGFLCALLINTSIANHGDHETYKAMCAAIKQEETFNEEWVRNDLSLRDHVGSKDCTDQVTVEALGNPLFVRQADGTLVRELGSYIATIQAMNSLRHSREALLLSANPKTAEGEGAIDWLSKTWREYAGQLRQRTNEIDKLLADKS